MSANTRDKNSTANTTDNTTSISHAAVHLRDASQTLSQQAMFAHKSAQNHTKRAQQASRDLAELDFETVFRQLREMVAMVSNKPLPNTHAPTGSNTVTTLESRRPMLRAAE